MARAIWSGNVTFGLVTFPVKLFSATESKDVSFHLLHQECGTRIKQLRWCPTHEREVPWDEIVRGYEYAREQYVILTDEDFEKLPLPSKHTVGVSAFVKASEVDPIYYEKSYYLEPEAKGEKPYALLAQALERRQLLGIATITMRKKEQLCALRPQDGRLLLETLYYPDEIRARDEADLKGAKVSEKELDMADTLIELLTSRFEPEEYHDHYREALNALIEAKLEGKEIREPAAAAGPKVIDLADALRRSVAAARREPAPARRVARKSAPAAKRTRRATRKRAVG